MEVPGLILILAYRGPNDDLCAIDLGNLVVNIKDFVGKFCVGESVKSGIQPSAKIE